MAKVVDREALKRRKWHAAKVREKSKAERQKRLAEIFGDGYADRRASLLAQLLKV